MNHKRPPLPAIVVIVLVLILSAYFLITQTLGGKNVVLTASGFIEATQVNVASEMAGKVSEVLIEEGQPVKTGDPLLRLDPSLLTAQRAVATAVVDSAKAALSSTQHQYDLVVNNALAAQQNSTTKDWRFSAPYEFDQPLWYFNQSEQIKSIQTETDAARLALETAQADLDKVIKDLNKADFLAAETRLANARTAFLVADQVKTSADFAAESSGLQSAAIDIYNVAMDELDAAQANYNDLLTTSDAVDVRDARGKVMVAQLRYDTAYARLLVLQTGTDSPPVVTASKALDQAKAAVAQAEANLALLDTQVSKLTISAPTDGVVLTRGVEAGEFLQPGTTALVLGKLNNLTITVYVPEDRYGQLALGQQATVSVDSFDGLTFTATIIQIADQAEFTPRNVQTAEGRSSTVYAIKLSVDNPEGKLKIGMPADVVFSDQ
jgi:HlyD family secretion protein